MDEPLLTIRSREDAVELVLTSEHVRMKLADRILQEARDEIHTDPDVQAPGLLGNMLRLVTGAAEKLMSTNIEYSLDEIESLVYRDGALVFTYRKKRRLDFNGISIGEGGSTTPALASFAPDDAQRFVQRFDEVKAQKM